MADKLFGVKSRKLENLWESKPLTMEDLQRTIDLMLQEEKKQNDPEYIKLQNQFWVEYAERQIPGFFRLFRSKSPSIDGQDS